MSADNIIPDAFTLICKIIKYSMHRLQDSGIFIKFTTFNNQSLIRREKKLLWL